MNNLATIMNQAVPYFRQNVAGLIDAKSQQIINSFIQQILVPAYQHMPAALTAMSAAKLANISAVVSSQVSLPIANNPTSLVYGVLSPLYSLLTMQVQTYQMATSTSNLVNAINTNKVLAQFGLNVAVPINQLMINNNQAVLSTITSTFNQIQSAILSIFAPN